MDENLRWQKSTFSSGDPQSECVEVASPSTPRGKAGTVVRPSHRIHLRESAAPGVVLTTTPARLGALLTAIRRTPLAADGAEAPCSGA
ncbi:DUF397 domain-containing protein [Streptomyces sp. ST2-7A]|uniref:DUF397 domain-containing protein n=1 Tax=Streptomyces sp. ST2-7A TaxID=2907214 RepID=UPI001F28654C|nr:DUF397 domain-containing protein [Streptomyces sp. ST2-7A]MCE7083367.1 DUF397 domain-containing protein [Streptomyces sp. ST2-7A]